jgi:hypothetical protein
VAGLSRPRIERSECLSEASEYFGGVLQEVLFDYARPVVIESDLHGLSEHRWLAGMLEFARNFGFPLRVSLALSELASRPGRALQQLSERRLSGAADEALKVGGPKVDAIPAKRNVQRWLIKVANVRANATTAERAGTPAYPEWVPSSDRLGRSVPAGEQRRPRIPRSRATIYRYEGDRLARSTYVLQKQSGRAIAARLKCARARPCQGRVASTH